MKLPIYLDYASTTPIDLKVYKKMIKFLKINGIFGNSSSKNHPYGWEAKNAIEDSRNQISKLIKSSPEEIIFTSGATESNNLAIKGIAFANKKKGKHIITSSIEHKSILNSVNYLKLLGFTITKIVPKKNGIITSKQLKNSLKKNTILVSIMHVNNEIGTIQNIKNFGKICKNNNIFFHVDAAQSIGKISINVSKLNIDLMSFSAHKLYGPKGIGGLYISKKIKNKICTQIHGGGQEYGIRSGTLPVHQIVGMGEAFKISQNILKTEMKKIKKLRKILWNGIKKINGIKLNSILENSIPTILNISFYGIKQNVLISYIQDLAISTGSACTSSSEKLSHVLKSIGLDKNLIRNSIRISLGRFTTKKEINFTKLYINSLIYNLKKNKII